MPCQFCNPFICNQAREVLDQVIAGILKLKWLLYEYLLLAIFILLPFQGTYNFLGLKGILIGLSPWFKQPSNGLLFSCSDNSREIFQMYEYELCTPFHLSR